MAYAWDSYEDMTVRCETCCAVRRIVIPLRRAGDDVGEEVGVTSVILRPVTARSTMPVLFCIDFRKASLFRETCSLATKSSGTMDTVVPTW